MDAFEVEHEFPRIGHRVMLLNARAVFYADHARTTLLLQQKDVLLRELEHRVAEEALCLFYTRGLMYVTECRLPGRSLSGRRDLLSASCALRGSLFDE